MKKRLLKFIAIPLCASCLALSVPPAPALGAPASATSQDTDEDATEKEWQPFSLDRIKLQQDVTKIPDGHAYIPKDTILNVELETEITSKKAKVGDDVPLVTVENIILNDVVVIPKGTRVNAKVTKATGSGLFGQAGKLEFLNDSVQTINGVKVPLEYTTIREAGSDDGTIAMVAAVSIIGGLFMKGKNVSFPAGSKFTAKVIADTDLNVSLERLAEEMDPDKPHGVTITLKKQSARQVNSPFA